MVNKVIALAGLSGSGKSTLARTIEAEHAVTVVDVDHLFKGAVRKEGYIREGPFLLKHGVAGSTGLIRGEVLSEVIKGLKVSDVLIDNLYDFKLYSAIVEAVGRENMTVIAVKGNFIQRIKRTYHRGMSPTRTVLSDIIKHAAGLSKVTKNADFQIKKPSKTLAVEEFKQNVRVPEVVH